MASIIHVEAITETKLYEELELISEAAPEVNTIAYCYEKNRNTT